jgi:putative Mg2+ transporter-C (MgtC) family protein
MIPARALELYWSGEFLTANAFIGLNLLGALLLGMAVGYERSFNGRAAGMRTYGLVCMASTALTIFVGFAHLWYGGSTPAAAPDATRVVQGVVTGIGFLCAGVIVKDGMNISGLTTAASIWAAAAVGVLLGVGLYASALLLALLCMVSMTLVHQIEKALPGRSSFDVTLTFQPHAAPQVGELTQRAQAHGYRMQPASFSFSFTDNHLVWRFCVVALDRSRSTSPELLAHDLAGDRDVACFCIVPMRQ